MKYIRNIILLTCYFVLSKNVTAQDSLGILRLFVYPDTVNILIDNSIKTAAKSEIKLKQGIHNISIKGNNLKTYNKSFKITKDSVSTLYVSMKRSDEYISYNKKMFFYKLKVNTIKYGGATVPLIFAGISYLNYNNSKNTANAYRNVHEKYIKSSNIDELNSIKSEGEYLQKKYNRQYYASYAFAGAALITSYVYIKYSKHFIKKINKPEYINNIGSTIFIDQFNNYHLSINYKF